MMSFRLSLREDTVRIVVNGWFWDQMTTGSGQYLAALAEVLPRVGQSDEFLLALPEGHAAKHLPEGWRQVQVRTPLARVSPDLAKVWFEQVSFPRLCQQMQAAVAFVPYWGSPWWRPCPVVVTVHDLIPLLLPQYRGGFLQRLYTRLVGATARRAAAVITDSEASRTDIAAHLSIPADRVHAIYLAVQPTRASSGEQSDQSVRSRLSLPPGDFLLYLGGFDARKNVRRTIQAYGQLVQRCKAEGIRAPSLVIAGKLPAVDSGFAPDPRRLVQELGLTSQVHFPGWVDEADKAALCRLAAGAIFVSEYEGFGLPVLEAMAYARGGGDDRPPGAAETDITRGQ